MLLLLTLWALCCVSEHASVFGSPTGSQQIHGGDAQDGGLPSASSQRTLLQIEKPLIIGGEDAPEGRFPYACSLRNSGAGLHVCGGTLIHPEWVLTAAHCFTGPDQLRGTPEVSVGAFDFEDDTSAEVTLGDRFILHESFEEVSKGFDIALVHLREPSTKQPALLADSQEQLGRGQLLAAIGWGKRSERGPLPSVLQLADRMAYVGNDNCKKKERWPNVVDNMLCAFSPSQAVCEGDSGGPLLIANAEGETNVTGGKPNLDVVVGIVSFGPPGCNSTKPDVFTRVSSFRAWIDDKIGMSPPPPPPPPPPPAKPPPPTRSLASIITGPSPAPVDRLPYACSLRFVRSRIHACGGSLIAPEWVLTAAHCFSGKISLEEKPIVYVGAHGLDDEDFAEVIFASEVIIHESFTGDTRDGFDIALVRLKTPATRKSPVELAPSVQPIGEGSLLAIAGWGKVGRLRPFDVLNFDDFAEYVSNKNCKTEWPFLKDSMMCTFVRSQARCFRDSGGPLLLADFKGGDFSIARGNPKRDLLVGIVSFNPTGCNSEKPDGYTRVSSFREWIDENIGNAQKKK